MAVYRVHLKYNDAEHQSEDLQIDLQLDRDMKPVAAVVFFGVAGDIDSQDFMPCILYPDGIIDFGSLADQRGYRQYSTDLLESPLVEKGRCRVWGSAVRGDEDACWVSIERLELLF